MNRYYREDTQGIWHLRYLELDDELYCLRAVTEYKDSLINSSVAVEHDDCSLPEGDFKDSLGRMTEIEKTEFFEAWNKSTLPYAEKWNVFKAKKIIGERVDAEIICFYPQGVILNIGEQFYCLADYQECENILGAGKMYAKEKLRLTVLGFDNDNLWLLLGTQ